MFSSFPSTVQRHEHQGTGDIKAAVDVNNWLSLPYDRLVTCPERTKEVRSLGKAVGGAVGGRMIYNPQRAPTIKT